ncbi:MAG: 2-dehydro-3-deoxygalactonokinase [Pseudomonadota bacterium]
MTRWLAVDWGTSTLRLWPEGRAAAVRVSDKGMNALSPAGFAPTLTELAGDLGVTGPVIACGMLGARQGWAEAPYVPVPCAPPGVGAARMVTAGNLRVHILPGVKQARPADVMRGEETQIAGFLALNPGWDGVVCLPGTHTKWAHLSAGEIVSFQTFLTGEMFALLAERSILRHTLGAGHDASAFDAAVADGMSRPAGVAAQLFRLRAEALLEDLPGDAARARLSGLLIGAELAAAKPYWLGQQVAVIGDGTMADNYAAALAAQGAAPTRAGAQDVTLAGLRAAYEAMT